MVHVPVGVPATTECGPLEPVCQLFATIGALLPGALTRMSKYVCAVKFEPTTVATYVDPATVVDVDNVKSVTMRGAVGAIVPFDRTRPLLASIATPPIKGSPTKFPVQVACPADSLQVTTSLPAVDVTTSRVGASVNPCMLAKTRIVRPSCVKVTVPLDPKVAWLRGEAACVGAESWKTNRPACPIAALLAFTG